MQKSTGHKVLLLLALSFFLAEYLNPSAIGVRADYTPTKAGSPAQKNQTSKDTPSATTHFMIKVDPFQPGGVLPAMRAISLYQFLTEQTHSKEIFHPPALAL